MKSDAVIVFHDSDLVYKSLKLIMLYLDQAKIRYAFFKRENLGMSVLLFGSYSETDCVQYFGTEEDPAVFFSRAEADRIRSQFRNLARIRFVPTKLLKLRVPLTVDIERPHKKLVVDLALRGD